MWCDHTLSQRSKVTKRDRKWERGSDKIRSKVSMQYRVTLHKTVRF